MLETLLTLDRELFVWLNSYGSETWDGFWSFITRQTNWIPVFAIFFYLIFKNLGWKHSLLIIFCIAFLILITDQSTNFFKNYFLRLRPGNDPVIGEIIRAVERRTSYSFISGHASNSMAAAFFLFTVLRPFARYMGLIFIWPLIFAYSRIYLGLHYTSDILAGYLWGIITAWLVLRLYVILRDRFFPDYKERLDNPTHGEPVTNG